MSVEPIFAHALALIFTIAAIAAALLALSVRALFASAIAVGAISACAAAAMLALGAGEGALALALLGVGLAPVLMLGAILLSARASKAVNQGPIWFSAAGAVAAGAAVLWAAPELGATQAEPVLNGAAGPWLAALVFVAALAVLALLGFGERGPFSAGGKR